MRRVAVLGAILAVGLTACGGSGGSGTSSDPVAAVKEYESAWAEQDPEAVCDALTGTAKRAAVSKLATFSGTRSCKPLMKEALELLGPEELEEAAALAQSVGKARVKGTSAAVYLGHESYLALKQVGGRWYIEGNTFLEIEPLPQKIVISKEKAQTLVAETLEMEGNEAVVEAVCPENHPAVRGKLYVCEAELANGEVKRIKYRITDSEGHLSLLAVTP